MKKSLLLVAFVSALLGMSGAPAGAETLYFFSDQSSNKTWNNVDNWYVPGPNNTYTLAGRIPNSADDVVVASVCNASGTSPQLISLTIRLTSTLTGGNFDVGTLNFVINDAPGTGSTIGVFGTHFIIRNQLNFNVSGVGINDSQIIMQGGSFANVTVGPSFTGTTIFNEGSFVIQGGATVSFLGAPSRFDNIGDMRGNGGTSQISAGFQNLILNNSGTIRADSGTLFINGNIIWASDDGSGSFYPFTDDAVINIVSPLTVPANTTTYFKGPGAVNTLAGVTVNGTLQVGIPASGPKKFGPIVAAPDDPAVPGNYTFAQAPGGSVAELRGPGDLVILAGSVMNWTTGSIQADFSGAIEVFGALNLIGANNNGTDSITMNSGTINIHSGGHWLGFIRAFEARNAIINILEGGTFTAQSPIGFLSNGSPAPVINNFGQFNAIAGVSQNPLTGFNGITTTAWIFNNDGNFTLSGTGSFQIVAGQGSGAFDVIEQPTVATELRFATNFYTLLPGATFPGNGFIVVGSNGGLIAATGVDSTIRRMQIQIGGGLDGPGDFTVMDVLNWTGGAIRGTGKLKLHGKSSISSDFDKMLIDRSIDNDGSWTCLDNAVVNQIAGATINNLSGGTFEVKNNVVLNGAGDATFNNMAGGLFTRSAGTGNSTIGIDFNNNGLVALRSGTTRFFNFHNLTGGVVDLNGGNAATIGGTPISNDGGSLVGNGTVTGDVHNDGAISGGHSPGKITINGNYTQGANGALVIEIAGLTTPGVSFDQLAVTGTATLAGTLQVSDINGFTPSGSDTVPALTAGAISGNFDFTNSQTTYNASNVVVAAKPAPLASLLNISTRLQVGTGENVLIAGFIITGTSSKQVIIRAIGPSLNVNGTPVPGRLANPTLELRGNNGALITSNDDWQSTQKAEIEATNIPPPDELESAIVATLEPGAYTAIIKGVNNTQGIALAEVYDLTAAVDARLANISTRGFVQTGNDVMIGGFIVGNEATKVIVRAIGPSLQNAGVNNALADPTLQLFNGSGTPVDSNDNWKSDHESEIQATTIPPMNDLESAIVQTLAPGAYTAIVKGVSNTTGVGLVEVYRLSPATAGFGEVAHESGIKGTAVAGPINPVEQEGETNTAPLADAVITLQPEGGGAEIARTVADENGNFELPIDPGTYLLVPLPPQPDQILPRGIPQTVTVTANHFTAVVAEYDTGIR